MWPRLSAGARTRRNGRSTPSAASIAAYRFGLEIRTFGDDLIDLHIEDI
jgi:hypothetical protein